MTTILWATLWGTAGGLLAHRVGFPGGAAVGALFGSGVYNLLLTKSVPLPPALEIGAQIAVGVAVGFSFDRTLLSNAPQILLWALAGAVTFIIVGLGLAFVASSLGFMNFSTALFSLLAGRLYRHEHLGGRGGRQRRRGRAHSLCAGGAAFYRGAAPRAASGALAPGPVRMNAHQTWTRLQTQI